MKLKYGLIFAPILLAGPLTLPAHAQESMEQLGKPAFPNSNQNVPVPDEPDRTYVNPHDVLKQPTDASRKTDRALGDTSAGVKEVHEGPDNTYAPQQ
jgi:hypothetical protein